MYENLIHQVNNPQIKKLMQENQELNRPNNPQVHLSASMVVFKEEKMIFIEHPIQKELLLPAGHVEPNEEAAQTALRELKEETGFSAEHPKLIDVNLINIPENSKDKAHIHIDFRYQAQLINTPQTNAELPVFFLSKEEAPAEFRKYFP